jgi:hypothetical protein
MTGMGVIVIGPIELSIFVNLAPLERSGFVFHEFSALASDFLARSFL